MAALTVKSIEYQVPKPYGEFGTIEVQLLDVNGRIKRAVVPIDRDAGPAETVDKVRIAIGIATASIDGDTDRRQLTKT